MCDGRGQLSRHLVPGAVAAHDGMGEVGYFSRRVHLKCCVFLRVRLLVFEFQVRGEELSEMLRMDRCWIWAMLQTVCSEENASE